MAVLPRHDVVEKMIAKLQGRESHPVRGTLERRGQPCDQVQRSCVGSTGEQSARYRPFGRVGIMFYGHDTVHGGEKVLDVFTVTFASDMARRLVHFEIGRAS